MKNAAFFLLIFFILLSNGSSQSKFRLTIPDQQEKNNSQTKNFKPGHYSVNTVLDTTGAVYGLTQYYDYIRSGQNLRKLWVFGDTIIVACDFSDSLNIQIPSERRIYYQATFDGGITWLPDAISIVQQGNAYPEICPIISSGARTVCISGVEFSSGGFVAKDAILGAGLTTVFALPLSSEILSTPMNDQYIACGYINNQFDTLLFIKFDYINQIFSGKKVISTAIVTSTRNYIAADANGNVACAWWDPAAGDMWVKTSTDNGNTFGSAVDAIPSTTVVNGDHICSWVNSDIMYGPSGNLCIAASVIAPGFFSTVRGTKIVFWSPAVNGGNPVVIVDYHYAPSNCMLEDTNYYNDHYSAVNHQVGLTPLSHPSIAYSSDGSRLFCVFSFVQKDTSSYGFFYNDIGLSYSDNNGATWSNPASLTYTYLADEIYPTISRTGNVPSLFKFTYSLSAFPGSASFVNTTTPVSRVYQIFKKCEPVGGCYTEPGIHSISNEIPKEYVLKQNFPNPFNPSTKIQFGIVKISFVKIVIYDVTGREVARIVNQKLNPGVYESDWDATNLSSGVYFYSLQTEEYTNTKKMILLK